MAEQGSVAHASVSRLAVGDLELIALVDAAGSFPGTWQSVFPYASPRDWQQAVRLDPGAFGADGRWRLVFRCFVVRGRGGQCVMVDAGVGPAVSPAANWAPVPGRLPQALAEAGVSASDVTTVVLTHLHEDHVGWVVGEDGNPLFSDARYVVQSAEIEALRPSRGPVWEHAVAPLLRSGQIEILDGPTEIGTGSGSETDIIAVPTPGHTPGHQSVVVRADGCQVLITGDVLVHAVQLANPHVGYRFDGDPTVAAATRASALVEARRHGALLATAHLNRPFISV